MSMDKGYVDKVEKRDGKSPTSSSCPTLVGVFEIGHPTLM